MNLPTKLTVSRIILSVIVMVLLMFPFEAIGFSNRKDGKEKTLIRNIVKNTIKDYKENHNYFLYMVFLTTTN